MELTSSIAPPPEVSSASASALAPKRSKGILRGLVIGATVLSAVSGGVAYYLHSLQFEETDDAQVAANLNVMSSRVAGNVKLVAVTDNQVVQAGDLLVELDPTDYEVAVELAKANLEQAEAQLAAEQPGVAMTETSTGVLIATSSSDIGAQQAEFAGARHAVQQAEAALTQARATDKLAQIELQRTRTLVASGSLNSAEMDVRLASGDAAKAAVAAAEQNLEAARSRVSQTAAKLSGAVNRQTEAKENGPRQVSSRRASLAIREANVHAAKARLRQVELNLSYTRVVASVAGIVGRKSVSVGDRISMGQQLLMITDTSKMWVTANFRETQVRQIKPGQRATLYVDALGKRLTGTVESKAGATGSQYSLLPPENATGNYVKVVQRVPVRIQFDAGQPLLEALRPGLSVDASVEVK